MRKGASLFIILTMALMLGACAQPPIPSDSGVSVIEYPDGTKEVNYGPGQYGNEELQANLEGCRDWARQEQIKKFEHAEHNFDEAKARKLMASAVRVSGNLRDFLSYQHFELDAWSTITTDIKDGSVSTKFAKEVLRGNLEGIKKAQRKCKLPKEPDRLAISELFLDFIDLCG